MSNYIHVLWVLFLIHATFVYSWAVALPPENQSRYQTTTVLPQTHNTMVDATTRSSMTTTSKPRTTESIIENASSLEKPDEPTTAQADDERLTEELSTNRKSPINYPLSFSSFGNETVRQIYQNLWNLQYKSSLKEKVTIFFC